MKKYFLGRIGLLAMALCLVTTSLLSVTLAKYASALTGTGNVAIAKWAFKAGVNGTDIATDGSTFSLSETKKANANVAAGKIAPGDEGSIVVKLDATGSEVAIDYEIELDKTNLTKTGSVIKFYSNADCTTEITDKFTGTIALAAVSAPVEKTIYWKWDTASADSADTAAGIDGSTETFDIKVTATQKVASAA